MLLSSHSYYSLRYGTLSVEQLVSLAAQRGHHTITLTDINNTTAIPDFIKACQKEHLHPIAGIEFRINNILLYTGIAQNNQGLEQLNRFLTHHNLSNTPLPPKAPPLPHCAFIIPLECWNGQPPAPHEYIGVRPSHLTRLISTTSKQYINKMVLYSPATFANQNSKILHQHLRAIEHNTLLSKLTPQQQALPGEYLYRADALLNQYSNHPQIIQNTERLIRDCSINLDRTTPKNKKSFTGTAYDDKVLLQKLAHDGMLYRYGENNAEAHSRINQELEIIDKLGFSAYFLITWDIIRYSMHRGFYHVGRGSGANSIVAYCLRITDVDPIELDLYFERFINPKRSSPPDFDIDYSWKERDEVLDYIFKRHGHEHTALLGATSTFKGKSILRELSKVYGLPKGEIDQLVEQPNNPLNNNPITQRITTIGSQMINFPNLRTIHAGGVLISQDPITCYTALDLPPKGFPTTQWDMYVAEEIGFAKIDILSQRGLGHIAECADIISKRRGITVDVHKVQQFKQDKKVKAMLQKGETTGCFYIESPAMRSLLTKLRCDNYISLVAASSIIRPGVARSGMMREYIHRFHNPSGFTYIHPIMEEQLKETYGVMVYQEDVLKICHHFAGLNLADADVLRRAMSGKFRSRKEFDKIVERFFAGCRKKGHPEAITHEVWRQIESFAGYSFSKAHSASYAVESYQSLYLKAYFPREFMVAVINNFGGFYHTWLYINEARRWGAQIHLPCVNRSLYTTTIYGKAIYLGFIHINSLTRSVTRRIIASREEQGPYTTLDDFVQRTACPLEQLLLLIRINALRCTGQSKKELLWQAHLLAGKNTTQPLAQLFHEPATTYTLPQLSSSTTEDAYDEIELLGFPVTINYFDLLKTSFRGDTDATALLANTGKTIRITGQLVTIKYVRTIKNQIMHFATFLDAHGNFFDTIHFPNTLKQYPFRGYGVYLIMGRITQEFNYPSLEVIKMARLPLQPDPRNEIAASKNIISTTSNTAHATQ